MLKLYKFRPLGDKDSFERASEILKTGKFWCSPLWEQNDPMEGVYTYLIGQVDNRQLDDVFTKKNKKRICSFSGQSALVRPTMWGHYANGFKGIAIEIEVEETEVKKVMYRNDTEAWGNDVGGEDPEAKVVRILTTKLTDWRIEEEYRYLTENASQTEAIGKIKRVYFGVPYKGVGNTGQITAHSSKLQKYLCFKKSF